MAFDTRDLRTRFSIVLLTFTLLSVVAGYAVTSMADDLWWIMAFPLLALFCPGNRPGPDPPPRRNDLAVRR